MGTLVSILIPAFNAERWLEECLCSALAQTWPRKEVIVVDDGSTDGTRSIAGRYESKDVVVVSQPNQGAAAARNTALTLSQGDYIQWLDADDVLARDKVARQMRVALETGSRSLISGPWGEFRYRIRKAVFSPSPLWCDLTPAEWLIRKMGQNLHMQPDSWLVSRELTDAAGPWDTRLWRDNDGEYFARVLLTSDQVRFVPDARSYYRRATFSSVSYIGRSNKKLESLCTSIQRHVRYLLSLENTARSRAACVSYIQQWLREFYPHRSDLVDQLEALAYTLDGRLSTPRFSWKYEWIRASLGWEAAREAQLVARRTKGALLIAIDRAFYAMEGLMTVNDAAGNPPGSSDGGSTGRDT